MIDLFRGKLNKADLVVDFKYNRLEFHYGIYENGLYQVELLKSLCLDKTIYKDGLIISKSEFAYILEKTIKDFDIGIKRLILLIGEKVEIKKQKFPKLDEKDLRVLVENNNPFDRTFEMDYIFLSRDENWVQIMYFGMDRKYFDLLIQTFSFLKKVKIYVDHELNALQKYKDIHYPMESELTYLEIYDEKTYRYEYRSDFFKREEIDEETRDYLIRESEESLIYKDYSEENYVEESRKLKNSPISLGGFIRYD